MAGVDRYYVIEQHGYSMAGGRAHLGSKAGVSFSLLDRYNCHREVAQSYAVPGAATATTRRQRIHAECSRLNALDSLDAA